MARAKEFDREVVLERAMRFFWEQGYEAASMRDLLDVMEIGRQSLYDTFGDKHSLFLASLAYYYEIGIGSVVAQLSAPDGGLAAIEEYFDGMARRMTTKPYRSCLLINSAIELAPSRRHREPVRQRAPEGLRQRTEGGGRQGRCHRRRHRRDGLAPHQQRHGSRADEQGARSLQALEARIRANPEQHPRLGFFL
ncbi:MAG: TetR/AcrR family transcriptional regulator [Deltaproteobacteria bacterium]|nr:TetR/AcrR family transcriptional regulator [Deltaproteobacteria bacterium]